MSKSLKRSSEENEIAALKDRISTLEARLANINSVLASAGLLNRITFTPPHTHVAPPPDFPQLNTVIHTQTNEAKSKPNKNPTQNKPTKPARRYVDAVRAPAMTNTEKQSPSRPSRVLRSDQEDALDVLKSVGFAPTNSLSRAPEQPIEPTATSFD